MCVCARVLEFSLTGVHHKISVYQLSLSSTCPSHAPQMQCVRVCVCVYVCACVHAHMCVCVMYHCVSDAYLCMCVCECVCVLVCMRMHVCVCVCVCACVLLWTHGSKDIGIQSYCPLTYIYISEKGLTSCYCSGHIFCCL